MKSNSKELGLLKGRLSESVSKRKQINLTNNRYIVAFTNKLK